MNGLENATNPRFRINVGDCSVQAVLGAGFLSQFRTSPEIHFHTYYELLIALDGELEILLSDRKKVSLNENTLCLIPPQVWHATMQQRDGHRKLAIRFLISQNNENEAENSVYRLVSSAMTAHQALWVWTAEESQAMFLTLRELYDQMQKDDLAKESYVQALLTQFFILLFRLFATGYSSWASQSLPGEDEIESRRLRIETFFVNHFHEPITEEDLARHMNLSKRQLSRLLNRIYASSFRQILIQIRLQRAAQFLREGDRSVEEIAYSVGYGSLSGFYSAFLQTFRMTAGEYRKKLRDFC